MLLASALPHQDAFDSVLVFADATWIGTAAENPSEAPLPLPPALAATAAAEDDAAFAHIGGGSAPAGALEVGAML